MSTPSHLIRRGNIYYFRRKVPLHLRAQVGKDEIRKSLGTADLQRARVAAAVESARLDQEFGRLRQERFSKNRQEKMREDSYPASLADLFDEWRAVRDRPRTTVYDFAKAMKRFAALYPRIGVRMIEPQHMEGFKAALLAEGMSAGTVRKQFGALSAMLELAVTKGVLPDNPARGLRLGAAVGEPQAKRAFTDADLRALFSTSIYREGERPQGGAGAAAYWLPLLALYTGARLGELGALRVADVREEKGIKYLALAAEQERARRAGRPMPLHGDLVRLGFLQFVEMQRRAGEVMLFDELRADNKGKLTGNWSKWFARHLRVAAQIADPRKSFDSFRPSFIESCNRAALPQTIKDALMGRGNGGDAEIPLTELAAAVQVLRFRADVGAAPT